MITACFARALQRCAGRLYMGFLFIFQAVRPIDKTRNQLILCFEGEYTIEEHLAVLMVEIGQ
jgi:hypothetical protein